jgi:hypothetical protein
MKKLLFITIFITQYAFAQSNATFYFIFNDTKLTKEDIKRKINFIIESSDAKKTKFEVIHFTNKNEAIDSWPLGKSVVNYKPTRITCEFDLCVNVTAILSVTKTGKSKLYHNKSKILCDFGVETTQLSNTDESTILDKLNQEILSLSKEKTPQSTYFLFNNEQSSLKPSLTFNPSKIIVKQSESVKLLPIVTGEFFDYVWSPVSGLSCSNCKNPEVTPLTSTKYTLTAKDSSGCYTVSASLDIEVEKNCECSKGVEKIEIQFGKLPIKKFEKKQPGVTAEWEWRIISNQSGGYVFDVVTNPNCAKKFRVKVLRSNGAVMFDQYYNKEDVDNRSRNPYHEKFPDKFIFRIDLSDDRSIGYIEDADHEPYFIIEIVSIDDFGNECEYNKYLSPRIRPTKCN